MDSIGIAILIGCLGGPIVIIGLWWRKRQREVNQARLWPQTEATVESGEAEFVGESEYAVRLPVFAFSYKVEGAYYSGRFALLPYTADPGESIYARMAGRKLQVHYDPHRPEAWFLSDALIEGCKVEQKIGLHLNNYYPT